jgi:hypothetical protein
MPSHKDKLLAGEPYLADDPELLEDRHRCRLLSASSFWMPPKSGSATTSRSAPVCSW